MTPATESQIDRDQALRRARLIANVMDTKYRLPVLGIRFGLDPVIGLVPVIGDTVTALIGVFMVLDAIRLKARRRTIIRMLINLGVDWLLGLVPLIDIVLDTAFKAHARNARLLVEELQRRE